ncbi:ATP-sensitive inward rectifier potassium channel 10 [Salarias fasciatus]|uniref:ATP-sensitive inward rectifier potassium channel 10 n=1 Tax=Salarias fasciatus TaxID=181472 RepID=UPI001176615F|nr:ATP-sensitive inward rectifier potassium channel 10-like [Salarias fasciatus]
MGLGTTIGYGFCCISEECPLAIFTLVAQLVITGLAEIFVTGTFLAKLARPKKLAETIKFSQSAAVCRRRGPLCLMLRVANMRKSLLIQCQLTGKLFQSNVTGGGREDADPPELGGLPHGLQRRVPIPHPAPHLLPRPGRAQPPVRPDGGEPAHPRLPAARHPQRHHGVHSGHVSEPHLQEILWGYEFKPVLFSTPSGRYVANFKFFDKVQASSDPAIVSNNTEKLKLEEDDKKG